MERYRPLGFTLLLVAILASAATACSGFSLFGGIAGGVLTVAAVVFWFVTATTQTGCTSAQVCLSLIDAGDGGIDGGIDAGTDAGDARIGPCLSVIFDGGSDSGVDDRGTISPCLSDAAIGPCLTAPPPDGGEDLDGTLEVGAVERPNAPASSRLATIERLRERGVLPADVAARLKGSSSNDDGGEEA